MNRVPGEEHLGFLLRRDNAVVEPVQDMIRCESDPVDYCVKFAVAYGRLCRAGFPDVAAEHLRFHGDRSR